MFYCLKGRPLCNCRWRPSSDTRVTDRLLATSTCCRTAHNSACPAPACHPLHADCYPPSPASHTPHTRPHTHNATPPGHGHHDHGQERVGPRGGGRRAAGAVPSSQHACAWMCVTPCGITSTAPAFSGISQCCARQRACTAACCTPALCCTSPLRTCRAALHSSQAFALSHSSTHPQPLSQPPTHPRFTC